MLERTSILKTLTNLKSPFNNSWRNTMTIKYNNGFRVVKFELEGYPEIRFLSRNTDGAICGFHEESVTEDLEKLLANTEKGLEKIFECGAMIAEKALTELFSTGDLRCLAKYNPERENFQKVSKELLETREDLKLMLSYARKFDVVVPAPTSPDITEGLPPTTVYMDPREVGTIADVLKELLQGGVQLVEIDPADLLGGGSLSSMFKAAIEKGSFNPKNPFGNISPFGASGPFEDGNSFGEKLMEELFSRGDHKAPTKH